jgi:hypothetical protein
MECHKQHSAASEATERCVACHEKSETKSTLIPASALFTKGHETCGSCHTPHRFEKKHVKSCRSCHDDQETLGTGTDARQGKRKPAHQKCSDCHAPHASQSAPIPCARCHEKVKTTHPAPEADAPAAAAAAAAVAKRAVDSKLSQCLGCHPIHTPGSAARTAVACSSCHEEPKFARGAHGKDADCTDCHNQHTVKLAKDARTPCLECHAKELGLVSKNKSHAKCEACHEGLPHQPIAPKTCLSCHEKQTSAQPSHKECKSCHETHSTATKTCLDCHKKPELPALHAEVKHQECKACHVPHGAQPGPERLVCSGTCHKAITDEHRPETKRCTGCHLFTKAQKAGDDSKKGTAEP